MQVLEFPLRQSWMGREAYVNAWYEALCEASVNWTVDRRGG